MALTLLARCSFQNGLDITDFPFLFQGQEAQGNTRRTPLGSILRRLPYIVLVSEPEQKAKSAGR
jgi:hypothetical protein